MNEQRTPVAKVKTKNNRTQIANAKFLKQLEDSSVKNLKVKIDELEATVAGRKKRQKSMTAETVDKIRMGRLGPKGRMQR